MGFALIRTMNRNRLAAGDAVDVQADVSPGMVGLTVVGNVFDMGIRDRVRIALRNSPHAGWPDNRRVTVLLSRADEDKHGTHFDLPAALAILGANNRIDTSGLDTVMFFGELGLDGSMYPVRLLPEMVTQASEHGVTVVVVPEAQVSEVKSANPRLAVVGASSLPEVVKVLESNDFPKALQASESHS